MRWPAKVTLRTHRVRTSSGFALLLLAAGTQVAYAETAVLKVLGFSPDGRYFAFQESGQGDTGGEFRYTFAIEVSKNRSADGSPVLARWDEEGRTVENDKGWISDKKARAQTQSLIKRLRISETGAASASIRQARARGNVDDFPSTLEMQKNTAGTLPLPREWFGTDARLVLTTHLLHADCPLRRDDTIPKGFAVKLERGPSRVIEISRDKSIPESRLCPIYYGLVEAHALALSNGDVALAAIVQYFNFGWHGIPDRRFVAVTAIIPSGGGPE